jgi:nitrogen fixation-related uncharacterized protein
MSETPIKHPHKKALTTMIAITVMLGIIIFVKFFLWAMLGV